MINNQDFHLLKEEVSIDNQGCINVGQSAIAQRDRVLINAVGQILLDPVCESEQEQWLWQNAQALASVQTGLEDV